MGYDESKFSFLRTYWHWLILEPQTYVVVEQFGAENIPLLSGRLVYNFAQKFAENVKNFRKFRFFDNFAVI